MSQSNFPCFSEEMKVFLRDFLQDVKLLVNSIKSNLYKVASIQSLFFSHGNTVIYPNMPSIFKNCNMIHQDLKKIHLILKGLTSNRSHKFNSINKFENTNQQNHQINYTNITFQNINKNISKHSQKINSFDPIITESFKINLQKQEQNQKSKLKIHLRNKTQIDILKIPSDKQLTDVQSIGDSITKRTNFSTIRRKSPLNTSKNYTHSIDQISQFSHFSIKNNKNNFEEKAQNLNQSKKDPSLFFTFNKIQKLQESKQSIRAPRIGAQQFKRSSQCFRLIRSIRTQLSK